MRKFPKIITAVLLLTLTGCAVSVKTHPLPTVAEIYDKFTEIEKVSSNALETDIITLKQSALTDNVFTVLAHNTTETNQILYITQDNDILVETGLTLNLLEPITFDVSNTDTNRKYSLYSIEGLLTSTGILEPAPMACYTHIADFSLAEDTVTWVLNDTDIKGLTEITVCGSDLFIKPTNTGWNISEVKIQEFGSFNLVTSAPNSVYFSNFDKTYYYFAENFFGESFNTDTAYLQITTTYLARDSQGNSIVIDDVAYLNTSEIN